MKVDRILHGFKQDYDIIASAFCWNIVRKGVPLRIYKNSMLFAFVKL